jgi:hypothetical protein
VRDSERERERERERAGGGISLKIDRDREEMKCGIDVARGLFIKRNRYCLDNEVN